MCFFANRDVLQSVKHKSFFQTDNLHNITANIGMLFNSMDTTVEQSLTPIMSLRVSI